MSVEVPPNWFAVITDMGHPPRDRIVLQPYQEDEWGRDGEYPMSVQLVYKAPAKFSQTSAAHLLQYVRQELVQDFKDRANRLIIRHIFRPQIQTHEAVLEVDPPVRFRGCLLKTKFDRV